MLGLATRLLGDRLEAEDLVHDVFVEAWNKADAFCAERGSTGAWLMVRIRSRAIDRLRRSGVARRHAAQTAAMEAAGAAAAEDPARACDRGRVAEALSALSPEQRSVIERAYFGGLSCADIARESGTPLGTVKSRLAAATRELRRYFDAEPSAADEHAGADAGAHDSRPGSSG